MSEPTATQINLLQSRMDAVAEAMMRDPIYQADRISGHYLAHVAIAKEIQALLNYRNCNFDNTNIDACIGRLLEEIKNNHAHELGIELRWETPKI